jgi:hypothetical protein
VFLSLGLVAPVFSASNQKMDGHRTAKASAVSSIFTTVVAIAAALTFEQYFCVCILWRFLKWRAWILDLLDDKSLRDRRERILRGSRLCFWLTVETGRAIRSWLP